MYEFSVFSCFYKEQSVYSFIKKKKVYKMDCNNYRGIAVVNNTYKIFLKIVQEKLKPYVNTIIEEN